MKHHFVFALAAALAVSPTALTAQAHGQHHGSAEARGAEGRGYMFQRMQSELDLSPQQVDRLRAISTRLEQQNRPLMEQLRAAGVWSRGADKAAAGERHGAKAARGQREQMRARMQDMTPEQREQMRARMQNMTPEQREQMRARMQDVTPEQREQMRARMQQRMQREVPAEMQPVLQQVRENSRVAMEEARSVLTAEQQARLSQLVAQRGHAQGRRPGR
jgi:Spy/CpxP family protein refolding chaperone